MNEKLIEKIGIESEKGNFAGGLSLIIWSIAIAIIVGLDTTGTYNSLLIGVVLLPPIGSYLVISSVVKILKAIREGE